MSAPAADDGPLAVVIPFPVPPRPPNWERIDRLAAEMGLWDGADPWSLLRRIPPPRLRVVR